MNWRKNSSPANATTSSAVAVTEHDDVIRAEAQVVSAPSKVPTVGRLRQLFSFPAMLGSLLVVAVFVAKRDFDVDPDFWWHLKVGEDILATHRWTSTDPYSFTAAGQPWLASEWLGDVVFAAVSRLGGLLGLQLLLIILGSAIILALYGYAASRSKNSKAGFITAAVLLWLATANFNLRPQMFGYLFLVLTLIALERFRQGKSVALWFLPVLFLMWINTHGSWEIGLGAILVYWVSGLKTFRFGDFEMAAWKPNERVRLSTVFLLCLIVLPMTPYGTRLAAYPFGFISSLPLNLANINEWQPMPFNLFAPKLFLALVLGVIAAQIAFQLKWRMEDFILFFGGAAAAFVHRRFLLIFVPFFAPVLATILARWVPQYHREKDPYVLNGFLMAIMLGAMIYYFPSRARIEENVSTHFPVGAVSYLRSHPVRGPVFNSYVFGGYLVYAQDVDRKVFIDGRADLYERGGVYADYLRVSLLQPGALGVLRNYGIRGCLIEKGEPLAVLLSALSDWKSVYSDDVSVLLVRKDIGDSVNQQ
jgi:hypothetical protein